MNNCKEELLRLIKTNLYTYEKEKQEYINKLDDILPEMSEFLIDAIKKHIVYKNIKETNFFVYIPGTNLYDEIIKEGGQKRYIDVLEKLEQYIKEQYDIKLNMAYDFSEMKFRICVEFEG